MNMKIFIYLFIIFYNIIIIKGQRCDNLGQGTGLFTITVSSTRANCGGVSDISVSYTDLSTFYWDTSFSGGSIRIDGGQEKYFVVSPTSRSGSQNFPGISRGSHTISFAWQGRTPSPAGEITISCSQDDSHEVLFTDVTVVSPTASAVTCNGGNNGVININPSAGSGSYTNFALDGNWGYGQTITNLPYKEGGYIVQAVDSDNCQSTIAHIDVPQPQPVSYTRSITQPTCPGGGVIDMLATGGNGVFKYRAEPGFTWGDQKSFALAGGDYTIQAQDTNGCVSGSEVVSITSIPDFSVQVTVDQPTCGRTGTINIAASGGTAPLSYSVVLPGNNPIFGPDSQFTRTSETYNVYVQDAKNCQPASQQQAVVTFVEVILSTNVTQPKFSSDNGVIVVSATGGSSNYTFSVVAKGTEAIFTETTTRTVPPGIYTVIAKDASGCQSIPADITIIFTSLTCGNGICEKEENCSTCYTDCGICSLSPPFYASLYNSISSSSSISVKWTPLSTASFSYRLQMSSVNSTFGFNTIYSGAATEYMATGLNRTSKYYFRVAAFINSLAGNYSSASNASTSGPPSPPKLTLAQHGREYLVVSWNPPANDGASAIKNYILFFSNSSSGPNRNLTFLHTGGVLRYRVDGLKINTTMYFSIQTNNLVAPSSMAYFNFTTDSEFCGDLICDAHLREDCYSCFFDCNNCTVATCPGTPVCSGKGKCNAGVCQCEGRWAGPDCSVDGTVPIDVGNNNGSTIIITPFVSSSSVNFGIVIKRLQEIDISERVVSSFDFGNRVGNITKKIIDWQGSNVTHTNYVTLLPNGAKLELNLFIFANATDYPFAGQNVSVPGNSVKYMIKVEFWPFESNRNYLQIIMDTEGNTKNNNNGECENSGTTSDGSDNLQWFKFNIDGLNGKPSKVKFSLKPPKEVHLSVPFFWENTEIDPVYSVLIDEQKYDCETESEKSSKKNISGKIAGAVVGAVVGTAILIGAGLFIAKTIHSKKFRTRLSSSSSTSSINLVNKE